MVSKDNLVVLGLALVALAVVSGVAALANKTLQLTGGGSQNGFPSI